MITSRGTISTLTVFTMITMRTTTEVSIFQYLLITHILDNSDDDDYLDLSDGPNRGDQSLVSPEGRDTVEAETWPP